jgi:hypothetical protein
MPAKSPSTATPDVAETEDGLSTPLVSTNGHNTTRYAAFITVGAFRVGLRRRTLLDERFFRTVIRRLSLPGFLDELSAELGYDVDLVDEELTQFLYQSSQVAYAEGIEFIGFSDSHAEIKRKFAAYIATPGVDDLWAKINLTINELEHNPDPVTAPKVLTTDPKS